MPSSLSKLSLKTCCDNSDIQVQDNNTILDGNVLNNIGNND